MANLFTIPNEILDEITVYLDPPATSRLLITCRTFCARLAPAMLYHATSPKQGVHALHWAADRGNLPLLQQILPFFPVDLLGSNDRTALLLSARAGNNLLVLEHLLVHGANAHHVDALGCIVLSYVCEAATNNWIVGRQVLRAPPGAEATAEAAVQLLLIHGAIAHRDTTEDSCPLMSAKINNLLKVARLMLHAGCDPNQTRPNGTLIIVWAVYEGRVDWVKLFLEYGADANSTSSDGTCVLMLAAGSGQLLVSQALISHGADVKCVTKDGDTLLTHALSSRRAEVAEYLAGVDGVDLTSRGRHGLTPIQLAAQLQCIPVIKILLAKGCPVDDVDRHGDPALRSADMGWDVDVGQILLTGGETGETPTLEEKLYPTGCFLVLVLKLRNRYRGVMDGMVRGEKV